MNALVVKEGQIVTDYDISASAEWCTPSILGCKACISVSADGKNSVLITIKLQSPVGSWSKTFKVSDNICFSFQPVGVAKIDVCISKFKVDKTEICFTFGGKVCFKVPFLGWKCTPELGHEFCIPLPGSEMHGLLSGKSLKEENLGMLLLLNNALQNDKAVSCN